jgi:hypothetical protein
MHIILTDHFSGDKISINSRLISSQWQRTDHTVLYTTDNDSWQVRETLEEIVTELNNHLWNKK